MIINFLYQYYNTIFYIKLPGSISNLRAFILICFKKYNNSKKVYKKVLNPYDYRDIRLLSNWASFFHGIMLTGDKTWMI